MDVVTSGRRRAARTQVWNGTLKHGVSFWPLVIGRQVAEQALHEHGPHADANVDLGLWGTRVDGYSGHCGRSHWLYLRAHRNWSHFDEPKLDSW